MSATRPGIEQAYRYRCPSRLHVTGPRQQLVLATSGGVDEFPYFFQGSLVRARRAATLLRGLMTIVQSRFFIPPSMLSRILAMADPVVTCNRDRLRFEGFSGCCGVYVRVDLLPDAVDGDFCGLGTTNVDFNPPMVQALARVRDRERVALSVGQDEVRVETGREAIVEKKVKLPARWIRGFVEVQAVLRRMALRHELPGVEANRFLRSLPRMSTHRRTTWIVPAGRGLRLSQRDARDSVRVGGLERLRVLEPLCPEAKVLRVFGENETGATAWELDFGDCRFQVALSPEVWRGFSGEGQVLEDLAASDRGTLLSRVRSELNWAWSIEADDLARRCRVDRSKTEQALSVLGTRGLVGYDLTEAAYYHRELPFDLSQVERLQPRLVNARKLLAEDAVRVGARSEQEIKVFVKSGDVEHRVRLQDDKARCTCPWFAKHQNERGPCKHVLAAQLFLEADDDT